MASVTIELQHALEAAGLMAPLAFVVLYATLTVLLVPGSIGSIAAGAVFGPLWGSVLTVLGATAGATAAFVVARRAGRARIAPRLGPKGRRVDRWLADNALLAMLAVRLVPLVPFNIANYAAGISPIGLRTYVVTTAVGIVPGTVAFVVLGSSASRPGSPAFLASLGALGLLMLAGWIARRVVDSPPPRS